MINKLKLLAFWHKAALVKNLTFKQVERELDLTNTEVHQLLYKITTMKLVEMQIDCQEQVIYVYFY